MQRHEQVIQLSDHVKNKLKQHKHPTDPSSFINSSDEFIEISTVDDGDNESLLVTPPENTTRQRRDTFTTYQIKKPSELFFTDRNSEPDRDISVLQGKYEKQHQQCQECIHREHIIHFERQRLLRLYDENKNLNEQLRSSVVLNQRYENDIQKLKYHLTKVNSHLYEYQIHFDQLKQKIQSEKKTSPKVEHKEEEEEEEEEDKTIEHLKRLRYEVEMYNRIIAAKQQQEEQKKLNKNKNDFSF